MFKIGNIEIKNRIFLAPMAGYTNPVSYTHLDVYKRQRFLWPADCRNTGVASE